MQIGPEPDLSADEFVDLLERSGMAVRRPVDDRARIAQMVENANLIVTARDQGRLIGVSRCVTDYAYCCYCSDLAVDRDWQRRGVGQALLAESQRLAGDKTMFFLIAAPGVEPYYEAIGMTQITRAYAFPAG